MAGAHLSLDELLQAKIVIRNGTRLQLVHAPAINVDPDHVVAGVGEVRSRNCAHETETDHGDFHFLVVSFPSTNIVAGPAKTVSRRLLTVTIVTVRWFCIEGRIWVILGDHSTLRAGDLVHQI